MQKPDEKLYPAESVFEDPFPGDIPQFIVRSETVLYGLTNRQQKKKDKC